MKTVGTRFLIPFGLLSIVISAFVFHQTYESSRRHANELIRQQAAIALEFNLAIRDYAGAKIRPVMESMVDSDRFIPETMSTSFISREIFEAVRKKFPNYVIRFSSDNPRNPINLANPDERQMIDYFRQNPELQGQTEEIQISGKRYLAHFTPKWIKPECMRCHGDPRDAPAELVERYGPTASFFRKVGDVAGLDTVAIPVEAMNAPFVSEMRSQSLMLGMGLVLLFASIFIVFRFVVSRRLEDMAAHLNEIAAHTESPWMKPVQVKGNDEISVLGNTFNKLLEQLRTTHASLELRVRERTDELRSANERLHEELAERRRAEEALQESQQRLADIIDFLPDATLVIDSDGKVIAWNRAMEEMTGIQADHIQGSGDYEYSLPFYGERRPILIDLVLKPQEETEKRYLRLERRELVLTAEAFVPNLRGREAFLSGAACALRDSKGQIVGAIESIRDISERKQAESQRLLLEAQLRQAQKMEAIGTLAGGIAHDFNNILAAIIGYTEMALSELSEHNTVRHDLEQVLKAGYRARDLVRQILVFSRMETGQAHRKVHVGRVLEEVQRFLRASLPTTIEICHQINSRQCATMGDPTQIHEVLMNLCTNAAHAMEEHGGLLELALGDVELDNGMTSIPPGMKAGSYLELKVRDTGSGMNPETMEHIFEPYYTTKEVGKGTGFGLAVVHGIVKRHGGAIRVESELGKGTTFRVYFPSAEDSGSDDKEVTGPLPKGTERILYVDDEEMLTSVVDRMLGQLGYQVATRTSSAEALDLFRDRPDAFDLVLTDYTMPHMTGVELAREMLAIRPDIPIILCTGFSERITEESAREAGIREFALKPLNMQSVATIIRRVLTNGSKAPSRAAIPS